MAYVNITNLSGWQYDNAPPDPGVGHPHRNLWLKSSNGIRTTGGHSVYVKTKKTTDANTVNRGEISKTFWDAH
tara:strand:+ start:1632 stop:1850 length:219 start_codon:yes stop_codon:yes gene_type:complete